MRISDWSSDVCSSDLEAEARRAHPFGESNPFKCNVIRKIIRKGGGIRYVIDSTYELSDELNCLKREAALITQYKRLHERGPLTNLAGGVGNLSGSSPLSVVRLAATLSDRKSVVSAECVHTRDDLGVRHLFKVKTRRKLHKHVQST